MRKSLLVLLAAASLIAVPATAQQWAFGAGAGPFIFGDFVRETLKPVTPAGTGDPTEVKLTGKSRIGFSADLERAINDRFAVRLEGAWTDSKLQVKTASAGGISLEAGALKVTTIMLPLVIRFNPRGTFRFHILGGPAYAMYDIKPQNVPAGTEDTFGGTRDRWGGAIGGGVAWWISNRWALEGQITDIITSSPFDRSEFTGQNVDVPNSQNVHTTAGIRVRF